MNNSSCSLSCTWMTIIDCLCMFLTTYIEMFHEFLAAWLFIFSCLNCFGFHCMTCVGPELAKYVKACP